MSWHLLVRLHGRCLLTLPTSHFTYYCVQVSLRLQFCVALPTHLIIRFLNVNIPETLNFQHRTCIYRQTINLQTHQITESRQSSKLIVDCSNCFISLSILRSVSTYHFLWGRLFPPIASCMIVMQVLASSCCKISYRHILSDLAMQF